MVEVLPDGATPLRTVATWGGPSDGEVTVSPEDQGLIEELRGVGYL